MTKAGAHVSVVMSANATRFVGEATFAALAAEPPVVGDLWGHTDPSPHTTLGRNADVVVVAPATARIISALATGASTDALSTTLIATDAPVVVCPAMHTEMWNHPAVRANVATLRERGVMVVDPESGALAGGDVGEGRLAETRRILDATAEALSSKTLAGRRLLVTAGGTREPIDAVRFVGNRSSGKQGHALAEVAAARGARVTLVTTSSSHPMGRNIDVERVETAEQMRSAVMKHLDGSDALVMAAAVADFRPVEAAPNKLKKESGAPEVRLEPTPDILREVARTQHGAVIVGFAAETDDVVDNARGKLESKKLDVVVVNDVSQPGAGFDHHTNSAVIIDRRGGEYATGLVDKRTVAGHLLDVVERFLDGRAHT